MEKIKGPSFRFRWHPVLGDHRSILQLRRQPLVGPGRRPAPVAELAQTFRRLREDDWRKLRSNVQSYQTIQRAASASGRPVKARCSMILVRLQVRRRLPARIERPIRPRHCLYRDMLDSCEVKDFARESRGNGVLLYQALAAGVWRKKDSLWDCSFRGGANIVAKIRNQYESYLDFYGKAVTGHVDPKLERLFARMGWELIEDDD